MPGVATVHEDTSVETLLYTLIVTDSDPVSCFLAETVPIGAPFLLKLNQSTLGKNR